MFKITKNLANTHTDKHKHTYIQTQTHKHVKFQNFTKHETEKKQRTNIRIGFGQNFAF